MNSNRSIRRITGRHSGAFGTSAGMTLIEVLVAMGIAGLLVAIALPVTKSALKSYHLGTAVHGVSGAIQSTRYQAIMAGYHYTIAFDPATKKYQLASKVPPATTFSNVGIAKEWSTTGDISISPATTLEFYPGGRVTATTGSLTFTLTNGTATETLTVSAVGSISVTP